MALLDIAHVKNAHVELEGQPDGTLKTIVVVDTDLELDVLHSKHDQAAVDKLLRDLYDHVAANPHHGDTIRFRTAR